MIEGLGVPYRDTSADALSWVLGLPAQPAHAVLTVPTGDIAIELRVLGASHQVLVRRAGVPGTVELSETVACLTGWPPGLPAAVETNTDQLAYRLATEVRRYDTHRSFESEVSQLLRRYGSDPHALVGQFPGHPLAVTVLAVGSTSEATSERTPDDGAACWSTWHTYPSQAEIVCTRTVAQPRESSRGRS